MRKLSKKVVAGISALVLSAAAIAGATMLQSPASAANVQYTFIVTSPEGAQLKSVVTRITTTEGKIQTCEHRSLVPAPGNGKPSLINYVCHTQGVVGGSAPSLRAR